LTRNSSPVHDQDTIRHAEDLVNLGRDYHDTGALARETADEVMDFRFGAHIDATRGLIEEIDTRSNQEPFSTDDLLLIPPAQTCYRLVQARQCYAEILHFAPGRFSQPA